MAVEPTADDIAAAEACGKDPRVIARIRELFPDPDPRPVQ